MKKSLLIIPGLLVLALAACGGGGETTDTSAGEPASSAESSRSSSKAARTRSGKERKPKEVGLVGAEPKPTVPTGLPPDSLVSKNLIEGDGEVARIGDTVTIQYVGADYKTGENYDSSWEWGSPYSFTLGAGEVIEGMEQGVEGMAVGDRRELVIPPALADPTGEVGGIPDKETVFYVIDLLAVE